MQNEMPTLQLLGAHAPPRGPRRVTPLRPAGAKGDQPERGEDRESQPEAGEPRGDFSVYLLLANRAANVPVDVLELPRRLRGVCLTTADLGDACHLGAINGHRLTPAADIDVSLGSALGSPRRWRRPTSSSPPKSPATSPQKCSPSPAASRSPRPKRRLRVVSARGSRARSPALC